MTKVGGRFRACVMYRSLIRLPPGAGGGLAEIAASNQRLRMPVGTRLFHASRASNAAEIIWSRPLPVKADTAIKGTPFNCDRPSSSAARMPLNSPLPSTATSHLLIAMISARPSWITWSAIFRSCTSKPLVASSSSTTTSAKSMACRASATDSFSNLSCTLARLRMPAVSIKRTRRSVSKGGILPSSSGSACFGLGSVQIQSTEILSRVIPASGPVISRFSPNNLLISVDLPAFGRPTIANFKMASGASGSGTSNAPPSICGSNDWNRSAMPSPCSPLIAMGSPKPSA